MTAVTVALSGCTSATGPTWTFAPAASPSVGTGGFEPTPNSSADPVAPAGGKIEVEAFDLGFTPAALTRGLVQAGDGDPAN